MEVSQENYPEAAKLLLSLDVEVLKEIDPSSFSPDSEEAKTPKDSSHDTKSKDDDD